MKNAITMIAATLMMVCTMNNKAAAQEDKGVNTARFGFMGGVNFSTLYTKDADNAKALTGFNVGVFSNFPITEFLSFQPELYYTTKGGKVTYNNTFVDGTAQYKLDYLELPLLIQLNITHSFKVFAGPYAAYMMSGKVKNESNVNLFNFEDNLKVDDYNRMDAGVAAGIGVDFGSVSIGARYNYGLTKVGKEKTFLGTKYTFPDASNSVLNFFVAVPLYKN